MATIDGIPIHVTSEKPSYSVRVSTYPIEGGSAITDHVEPQSITLNLTGLLVDDASKKRKALLAKMNAGATVHYIGRNSFLNGVIVSFDSTHEYTTANGMDFTMQLQQIRKVKPLFSNKLPKKRQTIVKGLHQSGRKQIQTTKKSKSRFTGSKRKPSPSKGPTGKKHTVRANQTWEALAYAYQVPLKTLRSWSPQIPKGERLKPGMVIIVG